MLGDEGAIADIFNEFVNKRGGAFLCARNSLKARAKVYAARAIRPVFNSFVE